MWTFNLDEGHKSQVYEDNVIKKIFGSRKSEVCKLCRTLHIE